MQVEQSILGFGSAFVLALVVGACAIQRPGGPWAGHCWNAEGDATCRAEFGDERPYCSHDESPCFAVTEYGCVAERPELDECYSPCGGGLSVLENDQCDDIADESESGSSGSGTGESGDGESGSPSTDTESTTAQEGPCDPPCEDPMICHEGACVECTPQHQESCIEDEMWCDVATHTCQPCTTHFQCPGGAGCDLEHDDGSCLPPDRVNDVEVGGSLADAFDLLDGKDGTLRLRGGGLAYSLESTLTLVDNQVVAIVPLDGGRPEIRRNNDKALLEYAFEVPAGRLYLWALDLRGEAGVRVTGDGQLQAEKTVFDTDLDAASIEGEAEFRSCMLVAAAGARTLWVGPMGVVEVKFSTLLADQGDQALVCEAAGHVEVSNSIVGSMEALNDGITLSVECASSITDSATEMELGPFTTSMFSNVAEGDLHIDTVMLFDGIAMYDDDDPLDDFDGDPRQTQMNTWAGADVPTP